MEARYIEIEDRATDQRYADSDSGPREDTEDAHQERLREKPEQRSETKIETDCKQDQRHRHIGKALDGAIDRRRYGNTEEIDADSQNNGDGHRCETVEHDVKDSATFLGLMVNETDCETEGVEGRPPHRGEKNRTLKACGAEHDVRYRPADPPIVSKGDRSVYCGSFGYVLYHEASHVADQEEPAGHQQHADHHRSELAKDDALSGIHGREDQKRNRKGDAESPDPRRILGTEHAELSQGDADADGEQYVEYGAEVVHSALCRSVLDESSRPV